MVEKWNTGHAVKLLRYIGPVLHRNEKYHVSWDKPIMDRKKHQPKNRN